MKARVIVRDCGRYGLVIQHEGGDGAYFFVTDETQVECAGLRCGEVLPISSMEILDQQAFCKSCADEIFAELHAQDEDVRQDEANL